MIRYTVCLPILVPLSQIGKTFSAAILPLSLPLYFTGGTGGLSVSLYLFIMPLYLYVSVYILCALICHFCQVMSLPWLDSVWETSSLACKCWSSSTVGGSISVSLSLFLPLYVYLYACLYSYLYLYMSLYWTVKVGLVFLHRGWGRLLLGSTKTSWGTQSAVTM